MSITSRAAAALASCLMAMVIPATSNAWTTQSALSTTGFDDGDGGQLAQAANASGDGVVAWSRQIDPYHSVLQARLRTSGGPWGPVAALGISGDADGNDPSVAIDAAGDALAIWDAQTTHGGQPNTDDPELEVAYAAAGHPFGPAVLLATPKILGWTHPFVGFDRAGDALAMWSDGEHLSYAARPSGGGFGTPVDVANPNTSSGATNVQRPAYALAADGSAVVAWYYYGAIYAAYRPTGGDFGAPAELNPATAAAQTDSAPEVAIAGSGRAVVAWSAETNSYTAEQIVIDATQPGSPPTFTAPVPVLTGAFLGGLAMDDAGEATIVGAGVALDAAAGVAIVRSPDGALGPPQPLGPTAAAPIYGVFSVAYDQAGDVFAAWRHLDSQMLGDTHGEVYVEARRPNGAFPGMPTSVATPGTNEADPVLATSSPGQATVIWPTAPAYANSFSIAASDSFPPPLSAAASPPAGGGGPTGTPTAGTVTSSFPADVDLLCRAHNKAIRALPGGRPTSLATRVRVDADNVRFVRKLASVRAPTARRSAYARYVAQTARRDKLLLDRDTALAHHHTIRARLLAAEYRRLSASYGSPSQARALGLPACAERPAPGGRSS